MPEPTVIVGSGAAATAAALALARRGVRPTILDTGHSRQKASTGDDLSALSDVIDEAISSPRPSAPSIEFVTCDTARPPPVETIDLDPFPGFALGERGGASRAGLYRFTDDDLEGFPLTAADLRPYFDVLTDEIGISGDDDDLSADFGETTGLLPPLRLSSGAARLYNRYRRKRGPLIARGIRMGRPRLGVLSLAKDGRAARDHGATEFWQDAPRLYRPAVTLDQLITAGQVDYRSGLLVESWRETAGGVTVTAKDLRSDTAVEIRGERLILAAGAIETTRIVLRSHADHDTALPLRESPAAQIPFVLPLSVGRSLDTLASGLTQLNLIWEAEAFGCRTQASILELTSPMRADLLGRLPLSARANLGLLDDVLPAMLLMHLVFPGSAQPPARLSLRPDGALRVEGQPSAIELKKLGGLLAALRSLGLWTLPRLVHQAVAAPATHRACTLPMRAAPGRYECDPAGRLSGTRRVYIADAAGFSALPAKDLSFAVMANAMRIAAGAARDP